LGFRNAPPHVKIQRLQRCSEQAVQIAINHTSDKQWVGEFATTVVSHFLVLAGAMLLAVQIRLQVSLGQYLPAEYQAQPLLLYPLLACAALITGALVQSPLVLQQPFSVFLAKHHPFRRYLVSLGLAALGVLLLLPDVSLLQMVYFAFTGVVLGILCIALPYRIYVGHPESDLLKSLQMLWQRRALLNIWLRFNIASRYSQRLLGILWIILLPVATSVVLAFAFQYFMRVQLDVPFVSYYMAAMIPYTLFSNGIINSTSSVIGRIGIISQVYFPREILVLLTLGEAVIDFFFGFIAMLVINLIFYGILPNIYFLFLPLLFFILVIMLLGLMFLASSLTVMVRDIPQLLSVLLQLLFFLTPIIYPISQFPENLRFIFVLNPIAPIIQGFRDIIVYARAPDPVSLYYSIVFAGIALVVGYSTFKSFETEMADYV
jgi:lipopolysaccharide transport system permease protein